MIVSRVHQAAPLGSNQMLAVALTAICLAAAILTGGLGSIGKPMPAVLLSLHHIAPYLAVLSAGVTLVLI
ncbi:MAG TPA: hypothetical protein VF813_09345 [Anaerolineaceae bacterium]